jgi:hypothetical protein
MKSKLPKGYKWGLLLISFAVQIEAFAQRGRFIAQDWGDDGSSHSHDDGFGVFLSLFALSIFFLVVYIRGKIQSFNNKRSDCLSKGASNSTTTSNTDKQKSSYEALGTRLKNSRTVNSNIEYEKEGWIRTTKKLLHDEEREMSDFINSIHYDYYDISNYLKLYLKLGIKPSQAIEQIKTRAISIPQSIEPFDGSLLDKFEIVIVPSMDSILFKRLLLNYNGIVLEESFKGTAWVGKEMTIPEFCGCHGDLQPKLINSQPCLLAKDGKHVYFVKELIDSFNIAKKNGEKFKLDLSKLRFREYFSMEDKKFNYRAYYINRK